MVYVSFGLQPHSRHKLNMLIMHVDNEPLTSSSSSVVLESVDSFTCDPSPFFVIILLPARPNAAYPEQYEKINKKEKKHPIRD